mgnify:FL=1
MTKRRLSDNYGMKISVNMEHQREARHEQREIKEKQDRNKIDEDSENDIGSHERVSDTKRASISTQLVEKHMKSLGPD